MAQYCNQVSILPTAQLALLFTLVILITVSPADAQKVTCKPPQKARTATVTKIIDFQTLKTDNGDILRLSGLYIPSTFGRANTAKRSLNERKHLQKVVTFLQKNILGRNILYDSSGSKNRYGFHVVMIYLKPSSTQAALSLQQLMLQQGKAVFYALSYPVSCHKALLQAEQSARDSNIGLWRFNHDLLLNAIPVKKLNWKTQNFHIVTGKIASIGQTRRTIYLNFEQNWRKDFTISIDRNALHLLTKNGIDLLTLAGKTVRARGWLSFRNGPMIEIQLPDNLEILGE